MIIVVLTYIYGHRFPSVFVRFFSTLKLVTTYVPLTLLAFSLSAKKVYKNLADTYLLSSWLLEISDVSSLEDPSASVNAS